jgi:phosphoglycerate dehydrogenase-like enzyme
MTRLEAGRWSVAWRRTETEWATMELGIYGLGRMGGNMALRLVRGNHRVVASNRIPGPVDEAAGATGRSPRYQA